MVASKLLSQIVGTLISRKLIWICGFLVCLFNVMGMGMYEVWVINHMLIESLNYLARCPAIRTLHCHLICSFTPYFQSLVNKF